MDLNDFKKQFIGDAAELIKKPNRLKTDQLTRFQVPEKNQVGQLDILYFPQTNSDFKYALVYCDVATNACDAEPMKTRDSNTVKQAYKIILKRKYVKLPSLLMTDGGTEFKGQFQTYLKTNHVAHQICTYHRQLLPVDHICSMLGYYLGGASLNKEIMTGKVDKSMWKKHLSKLISILNNKHTKSPIDVKNLNPSPNEKPKTSLLNIGDKVRVILNHPINYIDGSRLHGNFRNGDIRYSKEIFTIYAVHINPNQRILYQIQDSKGIKLHDTAFVKEHLKVIN